MRRWKQFIGFKMNALAALDLIGVNKIHIFIHQYLNLLDMQGQYAVLYGEIVNFAQLTKLPESDIRDLLSRHKTTLHSLADKFDAKVLDLFSDSSKLVFENPINALKFSIEIINKLSIATKIPYRISITFGDIIYGNDGIFGSAAIQASHMTSICPEGSVLVSGGYYNNVYGSHNYEFMHIGATLFKGDDSPTEIYALSGNGLYVPAQSELNLGSKNKNSLAILPFHNTSSEKELDYICDGIAEEVIDSLSKSKDLFVTARSSSFLFKNKEVSLQDISRKLNVSYVLDGSIRKRNKEYRISFQLVDCSTGYNVVSDTITSDFDTLYDAEFKITKSIQNYFKNGEQENLQEYEEFSSIDPTAYSYYLQGKHLASNWQSEQVDKAITLFDKTLQIIPNYAPALAGLSMTYIHKVVNGFGDLKDSMSKAIDYADQAIQSDDTLADGFISKAIARFWAGEWYVPDFETNITSALSLSPCNAEIRMFNGMLFLFKGDVLRALSELQLAKQLDPHSVGINLRLGIVQYLNRNYEDAFNTFASLPEAPKVKTYKYIRLAWCCILLKQYEKALEYVRKTQDDYEYYGLVYGVYLVVYGALKDESKFFEYKEIIEQQPETDPCRFYNLAILYKLLGRTEQSIENLGKTLQNPLFMFTFMQYDEFWEEFHNHPLFLEVVTSKYKGTGNQVIKIESDTKEYIELSISEFLYAEAQDNYTLIVFKKDKRKIEKILRVTLANVEKQLNYDQIIRCHRSYLINSDAGFTFHKSENKAHLKHPDFDISIPVSRSKEKELKELLKKI